MPKKNVELEQIGMNWNYLKLFLTFALDKQI